VQHLQTGERFALLKRPLPAGISLNLIYFCSAENVLLSQHFLNNSNGGAFDI
jgi:hypothetical protein